MITIIIGFILFGLVCIGFGFILGILFDAIRGEFVTMDNIKAALKDCFKGRGGSNE